MQKIILIVLILTLNVNKVITVMDKAKFNMALSDVLLPLIMILLVLRVKEEGFKSVFKSSIIYVLLIIWIFFVGGLAIFNDTIIDAGLIGIVEEAIKTVICIIYFWIGYNTLKHLSVNQFYFYWIISAIIFIVVGFFIYLLSQRGIYLMGNDPKYLTYYMGTDTDPNHAATYLSLTIFSMGAFAIATKSNLMRFYSVSTLILATIALLFTGSRGGILGTFVGLLTLLIVYFFIEKRITVRLLLISILFFFIAVNIDSVFFDQTFTKRLVDKIANINEGLNVRLNLSRVALMMGLDHPFFGVGRGNFVLNSKDYFNQIQRNFVDDIPHNTYFGLFAEVGFVGLLLYFSPAIGIFKAVINKLKIDMSVIKSNLNIGIWLIGGMVALAIQASVLNVENRRFLWFLAGVIIYYAESNRKPICQERVKLQIKMHKGFDVALIVITVFISIYTVYSANLPQPDLILSESTTFNLPVREVNKGDEIEITYKMNVDPNLELSNRLRVTINEISPDGTVFNHDVFDYKGAKGSIKRKFSALTDSSKFAIKFEVIDKSLKQFMLSFKSIRLNNNIKFLDKWYYLQPKFVDILAEKGRWTKLNKDEKAHDLNKGNDTVFGNKIKLLKSELVSNSHNLKLILTLQALSDMDNDIICWAYGYPENIHDLDSADFLNGYKSYNLIKSFTNNDWKAGEIRKIEFDVSGRGGIYNITCGFHTLNNGIVEWLYLNDEESYACELGWINIDELNK